MIPKEADNIRCINQSHLPFNINDELSFYSQSNPIFIFVLSYTETSEIAGITIAGANPNLIKYTPAADAEFLYYGHCKCIDAVPVTPDGKPTPAIITRVALQLSNIPFLVVDAGAKIKPMLPYVSFNLKEGKNIRFGKAVDIDDVRRAFEYGIILGRQLAKTNDLVIIGESIPGGTTTTLGILNALGIDAKFKVSSSMPKNPHQLKNQIVDEGMKNANIGFGELKDKPFEAISVLGDPMMASMAGLVDGIINSGGKVMLAGGTQMCSVIAILKSLKCSLLGVCIGTTSYVAEDESANLVNLVNQITNEVPVYSIDLHMSESSIPGLQAFSKGFVKEGVGAGGISIITTLKSNEAIAGNVLLKEIEKEYIKIIKWLI